MTKDLSNNAQTVFEQLKEEERLNGLIQENLKKIKI